MRSIAPKSMVRAYIECALWSSTDDDGTPLDDSTYHGHTLAFPVIRDAVESCSDFLRLIGDDADDDRLEYEQMGHDLWLTRNGHGAGFWDRGLGDLGDRLTKWAHSLGTSDLYLDDDTATIYVYPR